MRLHAIRLALAMVCPWLPVLMGAQAQRPASSVLRVRVADSTDSPVVRAELSVVRGLNTVLATAVTDSGGRRTIAVRLDSGTYELVARRIGYARASRFFTSRGGDTLSLSIRMSRIAQQLPTVRVTAEEDLKHKHLFIDADAIAASTRPIFDATDVIKKLRPDMIAGLSGQCPVIQEVWVYGRRIHPYEVPTDEMAVARAFATIFKRKPGRVSTNVPDRVITALASIRLEHIAEMRYHDCMDMSVGKIGGENAVYVVLKPGIAFEAGRGSYVADVLPTWTAAASPVAPPLVGVAGAMPAYRARVPGVFDGVTAAALDSCRVIDAGSGMRARTTSTGTVSLAFLPEGASTVRVEKPGYQPLTVPVMISPRDTVPITVVLTRVR